ncbi:lysosome-associated membrane glycoprotein 1-like [Dermatophagoides pteronyssinus]|uniref:lysosome-associated membrane glycoprotein 1-like n=1 Tax=Dermatophagoides pteronyssinus TaxID=6956 RepID=UPI003F67466D
MKNLIIIYVVIAIIVSLCQCQLSGHPDNKTTTTTTTTTTTQKPTTTTQKPTTTTPKPTPVVIVTPIVDGNITDNKNQTHICLRYHFSLLMRLAYLDEKNQTQMEDIWLPKESRVYSDHCQYENIESFWFEFNQNNSLVNMTFERNAASVYLSSIYADIKLSNMNENVIINITQPNPNFNVDKSHSYVCANNITIKSISNVNDKKLESEFLFSNISMQAFMPFTQNGQFSEEHNCQNEINDVVPIAVGAALTALVIIVMIAYFIGRRRSRRLAYQSV